MKRPSTARLRRSGHGPPHGGHYQADAHRQTHPMTLRRDLFGERPARQRHHPPAFITPTAKRSPSAPSSSRRRRGRGEGPCGTRRSDRRPTGQEIAERRAAVGQARALERRELVEPGDQETGGAEAGRRGPAGRRQHAASCRARCSSAAPIAYPSHASRYRTRMCRRRERFRFVALKAMEGAHPRPGGRRHHRRHHAEPHQRQRQEARAGNSVRVSSHHIGARRATGTLTRHSKCENRPCDPVVRNDDHAIVGTRTRRRASTCVGAWIWLKMFSNSTGFDLSRPRICVTTVFSRSTIEARLVAPVSVEAIARNSVGCRVATNAASFSHGPPARPVRIVSSARRCAVRRRLVDDDRLQPAAVDHPLRRVERDDGARAGQRPSPNAPSSTRSAQ